MKRVYLVFAILLSSLFSFSQTYNSDVEDIINDVSLDSLTFYLRNLSGEDSVVVNGQATIIDHRVSNWGNDLAAEYIDETLRGLGYETTIQDYDVKGKNVYAIKDGTLYPQQFYIICAHYDAVTFYGADDNASGCTAVLEAARIFKDILFEYSVIFAFWDEEELGLLGSEYYADVANIINQDIIGVINMDMITWDGNEDSEFEIHTKQSSSPDFLANHVVGVTSLYNIPLNPRIENPGTSASDHASFWSNDFDAVCISEEYFGNDFNPYYHTVNDRISNLNMPYFHNMAKVTIGSLASLAAPDNTTSVEELLVKNNIELNCFPNPSTGKTTLSVKLKDESSLNIHILNSMGQKEIHICNDYRLQGKKNFEFNTNKLNPGIYLIVANSSHGNDTFKLLVQ